jgi:hypothetical protein
MSSTGQATSPTSNVHFIINALANYAKEIGIDLPKNPFVPMLEQSNLLEAIFQQLHGQENIFDESPIVIANIVVAIGDSSTASAQQ